MAGKWFFFSILLLFVWKWLVVSEESAGEANKRSNIKVEKESDLRMGYGVAFRKFGKLHHDVSTFKMVIAMPVINISEVLLGSGVNWNTEAIQTFGEQCKQIEAADSSVSLRLMCTSLLPNMQSLADGLIQAMQRLRSLARNELRYVMPGYQLEDDPKFKLFESKMSKEKWNPKHINQALKAMRVHIKKMDKKEQESEEIDAMFEVVEMLFNLAKMKGEIVDTSSMPSWAQESINKWKAKYPKVWKTLVNYPQNSDPAVNKTVQAPPQSRRKREIFGIGAMIGSLYVGHELLKVQDAVNNLNKATKQQGNELVILHDEMTAVAEASNSQWKDLLSEVSLTRSVMNSMVKMVLRLHNTMQMEKYELKNLQYALYVLMQGQTMLKPLLDREKAMISLLITMYEDLIEDLTDLKRGQLSPRLVPMSEMERIRKLMESHVQESYPEYRILMKDVRDIYSTKCGYWYWNGYVNIEVPLYMTRYTSPPMDLFKVDTVHVPYSVGRETGTFTKLHTDSDYLALTHDRYLEVSQEELDRCLRIGNEFVCPQRLVLKNTLKHTCLSAIYFKTNPELVREICDFRVLVDFHPPEKVLQVGREILVANIKRPWYFDCQEVTDFPLVNKNATYFAMPAGALCRCALHSKGRKLSRQIDQCDETLQGRVWYTINQAMALYMQEKETLMRTGLDIRFPKLEIDELQLFNISEMRETDVIPQVSRWKEAPLDKLVEVLKSDSDVWRSKNDKALAGLKDLDLNLWNLDTVVKLAKKIGLGLAIGFPLLSLGVGILYLILQCNLRKKLSGLPKELWFTKHEKRTKTEENVYQAVPQKEGEEKEVERVLLPKGEVLPKGKGDRKKVAWCCTWCFKSSADEKQYFDKADVLYDLRSTYRADLKNKGTELAKRILHDEDEDEIIRKNRRLTEAGTNMQQVAKAINRSYRYVAKVCQIPTFESAIQVWKNQGSPVDPYSSALDTYSHKTAHLYPMLTKHEQDHMYPMLQEAMRRPFKDATAPDCNLCEQTLSKTELAKEVD